MAPTYVNIESILELEKPFKKDKYSGNEDVPTFTIIKGERPFILTAPHSVKTTEKKMETRNIKLAIELAKEDADKVAMQMVEKVLIPAERDFNLKKRNYNGDKLDILEIASLLELDPYLLRYYFYKTAEEEVKPEENYTGAYATYLAEQTGCHLWVRNNNLAANAKVDYQNPALMEYIRANKILGHIDIHGAKYFEDNSKNNFDIAVGTNRGRYISDYESFRQIVSSSYVRYQILGVDFDTDFQAGNNRTLCNQVHRYCGIMTAQFEINGRLRKPKSNPELAIATLSGSIDCISSLTEEVEKGRIYGKRFKS